MTNPSTASALLLLTTLLAGTQAWAGSPTSVFRARRPEGAGLTRLYIAVQLCIVLSHAVAFWLWERSALVRGATQPALSRHSLLLPVVGVLAGGVFLRLVTSPRPDRAAGNAVPLSWARWLLLYCSASLLLISTHAATSAPGDPVVAPLLINWSFCDCVVLGLLWRHGALPAHFDMLAALGLLPAAVLPTLLEARALNPESAAKAFVGLFAGLAVSTLHLLPGGRALARSLPQAISRIVVGLVWLGLLSSSSACAISLSGGRPLSSAWLLAPAASWTAYLAARILSRRRDRAGPGRDTDRFGTTS